MLEYLKNKYRVACMRARYQRVVQEQLLELAERSSPQRVREEPGDWLLLGERGGTAGEGERVEARTRARKLVLLNPHARNILRLLEVYVVGPGMMLSHVAHGEDAEGHRMARVADRLWADFLLNNQRHYSFQEHARRSWRDGEAFLRLYGTEVWPPTVRFVDPEMIDTPTGEAGTHGIVTVVGDVETPAMYQRIDPESGQLAEEILAEELLHTKVGVDSNQKRGVSIFMPILDALNRFEQWMETELQARRLQASIVLWRKVRGSPAEVSQFADQAQSTSGVSEGIGGGRRERIRAGTILTTSQGTDLQFLQPNTNFADAMPLGRMLLLCMSAGEGLPEFMLTSDASNGNYASTMVAEGPAVKMFQAEQQFFVGEFTRLWKWVMRQGMEQGLLPADFFEVVSPQWGTPQLVNRDRSKERLADVRLVENGILSRAEVGRREGVDPVLMRKEIDKETETGPAG